MGYSNNEFRGLVFGVIMVSGVFRPLVARSV